MRIIKVTSEYFEKENGERVYHEIPIEEVPTLEEFQKMYDKATDFFNEVMNG